MTDAEIVELALRRVSSRFGSNLGLALGDVADEIAKLLRERAGWEVLEAERRAGLK